MTLANSLSLIPIDRKAKEGNELGNLHLPNSSYECLLLTQNERQYLEKQKRQKLTKEVFDNSLDRMKLLANAYLMTQDKRYYHDVEYFYQRIFYLRDTEGLGYLSSTTCKITLLAENRFMISNWKSAAIEYLEVEKRDKKAFIELAKSAGVDPDKVINTLQSNQLSSAYSKYNFTLKIKTRPFNDINPNLYKILGKESIDRNASILLLLNQKEKEILGSKMEANSFFREHIDTRLKLLVGSYLFTLNSAFREDALYIISWLKKTLAGTKHDGDQAYMREILMLEKQLEQVQKEWKTEYQLLILLLSLKEEFAEFVQNSNKNIEELKKNFEDSALINAFQKLQDYLLLSKLKLQWNSKNAPESSSSSAVKAVSTVPKTDVPKLRLPMRKRSNSLYTPSPHSEGSFIGRSEPHRAEVSSSCPSTITPSTDEPNKRKYYFTLLENIGNTHFQKRHVSKLKRRLNARRKSKRSRAIQYLETHLPAELHYENHRRRYYTQLMREKGSEIISPEEKLKDLEGDSQEKSRILMNLLDLQVHRNKRFGTVYQSKDYWK